MNTQARTLGCPIDGNWASFGRMQGRFNVRDGFLPFPLLKDDVRDLILRMLVFAPASRITAAEALQHAYFRERQKKLF